MRSLVELKKIVSICKDWNHLVIQENYNYSLCVKKHLTTAIWHDIMKLH